MKYGTSKTHCIFFFCMFNQHFGKLYNICCNQVLISLRYYSFRAFIVIWLLLPRCDPSCSSRITLAKHAQLTTEKTNLLFQFAKILEREVSAAIVRNNRKFTQLGA